MLDMERKMDLIGEKEGEINWLGENVERWNVKWNWLVDTLRDVRFI
jgi:hypothetical protein